MMDNNHIAERLASMRREISDLKASNARYLVKSPHTALDKSAHALRHGRLLGIKQELSVWAVSTVRTDRRPAVTAFRHGSLAAPHTYVTITGYLFDVAELVHAI